MVFNDSFQVEPHDAIESRSCCICVYSLSFEIDSNSFVSSGKIYIVQNAVELGTSLIYIINSRGSRILPWDTPDRTGSKSDEQPSTATRWKQCDKYRSSHCHSGPVMP